MATVLLAVIVLLVYFYSATFALSYFYSLDTAALAF
jgi:hypothetical protein